MFKSKEKKYREMFYAEAFEAHEELNRLFTILEKNPEDKSCIESIFRVTHTVKGNGMAIGLNEIAELSHVLEDLFIYVKDQPVQLDKELFTLLFRANDKFGELVNAIKTEESVNYRGLLAKLELYMEKHFNLEVSTHTPEVDQNDQIDDEEQTNQKEVEETVSDEAPQEILEELKPEKEDKSSNISFSDQVQIPVKKLDGLLNLVGELIIEKDTIIARNQTRTNSNEFKRLHRITSDMQYAVMDIRLVQVGMLFNKFHRIARDVSEVEHKKVNLELIGTDIEIDRNILKTMSDSLVHLVRNAISHGIEDSDKRVNAGKPEVGIVTLSARNEKDTVLIEVKDDGKGIDPLVIRDKAIEKGIISKEYAATLSEKEMMYLTFESGFSNAETVNEISGRGVGMDVVKRSTESIGGQVVIESEVGKGTTFILKLPSSMAVKGALLFQQRHQEFAIPLSYTESVISISPDEIHKVGKGLITNYQDRTIPLVFLEDIFQVEGLWMVHSQDRFQQAFDAIEDRTQNINVVIANFNDKLMGIVVDKLLQQKEIVEKTLAQPLDTVDLFTGATILGNGNVCLVLNVSTIMDYMYREKRNMQVNYADAV